MAKLKTTRNVIVLEDDSALAGLLVIKLKKAGFEAVACFSANEALSKIRNKPDSLLLADYFLPDMNADALLDIMTNEGLSVNFIIMTGRSDYQIAVEMMKKGAIDFIVKDIGFTDSIAIVTERAFSRIELQDKLKESVEILKKNEQTLRFYFENIQDIFFTLDAKGNILQISPSVEKILGYKQVELTGQRIKKYFVSKSKYSFLFEELFKSGKILTQAILFKTRTNSTVLLSVTCNLIVTQNNEYQTLGFAQDLSSKAITNTEIIKRTLQAEEAERKKIAEALHDDVGPLMSVIKMYFQLLNDAGEDEIKRKKLLTKVSETIDTTIQKMRTISDNLTSNLLELYDLKESVESFIYKVSPITPIKFNAEIKCRNINETAQTFLYRCVQELINNAIKHSEATNVKISINQNDHELMLNYEDDGKGFDEKILENPVLLKGNGLLSILNRVRSLSGISQIKTAPGEGFQLNIIFDNTLI